MTRQSARQPAIFWVSRPGAFGVAGALSALLLGAFPSWAGPGVTARYLSDTSFSVEASDLRDMMSMEITIGYDSSSLAAPSVSKGAFSVRSQLQSSSEGGVVKITLSRPKGIPQGGSGTVAQLNFNRVGAVPGRLTFLYASYLDRDDRPNGMDTSIVNPPESPVDEEERGKAAAVSRGPSQGIPSAVQPPPVAAGNAPSREGGQAALTRIPSVLDAFREKGLHADCGSLQEVFSRENAAGIRQEPQVVLTDGETPVTVIVPSDARVGGAPVFNLDGAHLSKLSARDSGGWELTLLPKKGTFTAGVTVVSESGAVEFPLTVAPPLKMLAADSPEYLRQYVLASNRLAAPCTPEKCLAAK